MTVYKTFLVTRVSSSTIRVSLLQFRIFTAPFHYVGFADFWLADQLNSLTTVLLDLEYLICFYSVDIGWLGYTGRPMLSFTCFSQFSCEIIAY